MAQTKTRARKSNFSWLIMLGLLLVGGAAAVGTILLLGDVKLPFFNREVQAKAKTAEDHTGKIAVPLSSRTIPAYTQITLDGMYDAKTKHVKVTYVDEKQAKEKGVFTSVNDFVGRVMSRDKEAGYTFTEADFLPKGTRPGPTAGLEPNTRGMWVGIDQIDGLGGLKRNDRFDVMAVKYAKGNAGQADRSMDPALAAAQTERGMWDASNRILVQNGKIVVPYPAPGETQGSKGKEKVFIQVTEGEADPFTDALAVNAQLIAFSRSSRPGADATPLPTPQAPAPVESIEVISGGKTSVHVVPKSSEGDAYADEDPLAPETSQTSPKKEPLLQEQ